jgi:multidrug resistance efflux pump
MKFVTLSSALFIFGYTSTAFGNEFRTIEDSLFVSDQSVSEVENPYAKLYRKRLEVATLQVQSQKAVAENERVKWVRMKALLDQGAVPKVEAENQEKLWRVATAKVHVAENKAVEAKALLEIARERTDAGLDMPVCSYNP